MMRRLTITGSALRPQSLTFKARIKEELLAHVWPLFGLEKLRRIVDWVLPLPHVPM